MADSTASASRSPTTTSTTASASRRRGYRCVYAPGAELLHHEGHSRGFTDDPRETAAYRARWGARRERYYNPNLSLADERFAVLPRRAFVAPPPGPVRALMCAFNLNWEGAPYSQFEMTAELKRRRVVEPVVYAPADGPLRAAYEREGISVHVATHPLAGVSTAADYDAAIDAFARRVRTLDVDVVYGNTLQTFYAIDAAHRLGLPSIWNPRESEPWQEYFRQYPDAVALRALRCYAYPYRIVFVAHATAEGSAALDTRHNFTVIHNGLDRRRLVAAAAGLERADARRALGIDAGDIVLLLLGTVCERKGQHDLAQALALLPGAVATRVRTFFVGDRESEYQRTLHTMIGKLPDERRARVTNRAGDGRRRALLRRGGRLRLHVAGRELPAGHPRSDGVGPADRDNAGVRHPRAGARRRQRPLLRAGRRRRACRRARAHRHRRRVARSGSPATPCQPSTR